MGLGSYQDPGEEIGGKSSSSSSKSSSRSSPNPSIPTGGAYVVSSPSNSGASSGPGGGYSSAAGNRSSGLTYGDSERSTFNPSMPTGGSYVATTPTSGNHSGTGGSESGGSAYGFMPVGGGLMPSPNVSINPAGGLSMTQRSSRLASIPGYNEMFPGGETTTRTIGAESTLKEMENYIRSAAEARGIDPDRAVRVAKGEGLNSLTKASEAWQSLAEKKGEREPSYTPFQLLVGEGSKNFGVGLGDDFIKDTGLDPRDPENVQAAIDYALDYAAENGWSAWNAAKKAGIGKWDGLENAQAIGVNAPVRQAAATPETVLASMYGGPIPGERPVVRGNPDAVGLARLVPADQPAVRAVGSAADFGLKYIHPGQELRDPQLAGILEQTAVDMGTDLTIQSGYRGADHPVERAKSTGPGQHSISAADINMAGMSTTERKELIEGLREKGVNRFIAYSKSPDLLHIDMKDQRGDGSAYFMYDRTARRMDNAPDWYKDAAKTASKITPGTTRVAAAEGVRGVSIPTPALRPAQANASPTPTPTPTGGLIPQVASAARPITVAQAPAIAEVTPAASPADRARPVRSVPAPVPAPERTQPVAAKTPQSFKDRYIDPWDGDRTETVSQEPAAPGNGLGQKIMAGVIDIGVGMVPGVGNIASLYNVGAELTGNRTIGQRVVANAGNGAPRPEGYSGLTSGDSEERIASAIPLWMQYSTQPEDTGTFENKYIRPQLADGDWQTPGEKWGRA